MMTTTRLLAALAIVGTAAVLIAGPLTPPPGAPASTYKTLQEVEPRIPISGTTFIGQPGSYYLTQNITFASTATDVILINANDVTLDLNGYTITGGRTGVFVNPSLINVTIQNGTVRNTAGNGIFAGGVTRATLRNLRILNYPDAAVVAGNSAIIDSVTSQGLAGSTTSSGFTVGNGSRITNSNVDSVALIGINAGESAQISFCTVLNTGTDGIVVSSRSRVSDTTVTNAAANGMRTSPNTAHSITFDRCTISNVGLNGIQLDGGASSVTNSAVSFTGNLSTFGGAATSGVLINGSDCRVDSSRLFRCGSPVVMTAASSYNSVVRSAANLCNNTFTNQAPATSFNLIAPIASNVLPTGPWDNTFQ